MTCKQVHTFSNTNIQLKGEFKLSFSKNNNSNSPESKKNKSKDPLLKSLADNVKIIKKAMGNSNDIIIREVDILKTHKQRIAIIYADGLADKTAITDFIMESLMLDIDSTPETREEDIIQYLKNFCLTVGDVEDVNDLQSVYRAVLNGETVILLEGQTKGIATSTKSSKDRAISQPSTESVIRGPQESFTETLRTNTALIRRKIKDPNLWIKSRVIGDITQTDVAIMYINGIANDKIVKEVLERLDQIEIDGILDSGYIEELIQDSQFTPFPTVYNSERPDVIAAALLEGKVAIIVDGSPFVLIVPALFPAFLQAAEDYYQRSIISSLIRILRYGGIFVSLIIPSLYISITTFHQEMIPTPMLISIALQREGVPFPAFIEAILMEIAFEILREAGLRMPRVIGPAVSIVGTLIIGQAAVEAGIVSAVMVIIVSITAICSFLSPAYAMSNSIRMLRFPLMILAAMFGLFGVMMGAFAIILHVCSLRSFGIPYTAPFAPLIPSDQKDTILVFSRGSLLTRPRLVNQKNVTREQKPVRKKGRSDLGES
ncbi:spore germination protein [Viridibacillus arvi]|uniref:spore germination protein n=1 Tax=Viridibacillus arvi TaxID=263475 RepID=UPI00187B5238|nr:spore germination protein [Viridibacillus sp. JNUCC-6]QOV11662.1 spore germination protein [Viridibacillus sp. JNUCC-6]